MESNYEFYRTKQIYENKYRRLAKKIEILENILNIYKEYYSKNSMN